MCVYLQRACAGENPDSVSPSEAQVCGVEKVWVLFWISKAYASQGMFRDRDSRTRPRTQTLNGSQFV